MDDTMSGQAAGRAWELGIVTRESCRRDLPRGIFGELLATCLFLFVIITPIQFIGKNNLTEVEGGALDSATRLAIAIQHALGIIVLVYTFAGVSGAQLNPAVTFGLLLARRVSLERFVCYVAAQCLGAVAGAALATSFLGGVNGGENRVAPDVDAMAAFGGEVVCTFILVTTVFAATDGDLGRELKHIEAQLPAAIGFAVAIGVMCLLPVDGCSLNPARSLGTAVVANVWDDHWVFWLGPMVGGGLSALVWEALLRPAQRLPAPGQRRSSIDGVMRPEEGSLQGGVKHVLVAEG